MILLLNFCHLDRDLALKTLQWCGERKCGAKHDLVLQFSQQIKRTDAWQDLQTEGKKHFLTVSTTCPPTENEEGWPQSPNHGWMSALQFIRDLSTKNISRPWLFWEPDATPLTEDCFDRIESEYNRVNPVIDPKDKNPPRVFPFMGAEVTSPTHRMSGVAVYPPRVVAFLHKRKLVDLVVTRRDGSVRNEAFDSYFAPEWLPHVHFTPLIQNIHLVSRNPDVSPSFPTQESLALLDPRAVLFHRCKDGSLIDRLRERMFQTVQVLSLPGEPLHTKQIMPAVFQPAPFANNLGDTTYDAEKKRIQSEKMKNVWAMRKAEAALAHLEHPKRHQRMKQKRQPRKPKPIRTPEEQAKIDERMAKVRAGRKAVAA